MAWLEKQSPPSGEEPLAAQAELTTEAQEPVKKSVSTIPPVSPTFIPRRGITERIHETLQQHEGEAVLRQAVTRSMGGYGKTVAAILYAHEYADEYPGGRFFLGVESGDLIGALASLVTPLGIESQNKPELDAAQVSQTLRAREPSLLILDNVPDYATWQAMLGTKLLPFGPCRVLVTTRDEAIDKANAIQIGRLTSEEARKIYRGFCIKPGGVAQGEGEPDWFREPPSDEVADEITEWLGGLAVAVAAVGALMKLKPELGWDAFWNGDGNNLRGLRETPIEDLPDALPEVRDQIGIEGRAIEEHRRVLFMIDEALDALPGPERRAVEYAALLPHDQAPKVWLEALLEADASREDGALKIELAPVPFSTFSPAQEVLKHLETLDVLLPGGEDGRLLSLHRVWHARVNERAAARGRDRSDLHLALAEHAAGRRAVIVGADKDGNTIDNPRALTDQSLRWEMTPLAVFCEQLWGLGLAGAAAKIGVWLAGVLRNLGRYAEAASCLALTPALDNEVGQLIGNEDLAACYSNLAMIQRAQGDLAGARSNMKRAIRIHSEHFGADHPNHAAMLTNLASIQQDQGDLAVARSNMERAIEIELKHFAPDHSTLATSYSNLAMIQRAQGDLAVARSSMDHAIEIDLKHFAPDHPTLATRYSNLAMIQRAQGDLAVARSSMDHAIEIHSEHFGADHPDLATMLSNLATIQRTQGDLAVARSNMERAIEIERKHFASDHPNFATRYNNLAHICMAEGDRAEACELWGKALGILLQHFEEDHPNVRIVRASMTQAGCS